jgi:hypothetical protein
VTRETELLANPDDPFGRVVLVPFDGVTVVHWELMVEVVITFADSRKSGDDMVAWGVLVIERSLSEPVSKRIDAKCGLEEKFDMSKITCLKKKIMWKTYVVNETQPEDSSVDISTDYCFNGPWSICGVRKFIAPSMHH